MKTETAKFNRTAALEILKIWYPDAKLGKTPNEDLEFLLAIISHISEGHKDGSKMSTTLKYYRDSYKDCVSPSGRLSKNNGDDIAHLMEGLTANEVVSVATAVCNLDPAFLVAKYEGLNEGSRKMNASNRIRGAVGRGDVTVDDVKVLIGKI